MEMDIIEGKLDQAKERIKKTERCIKWCICLSLLLILLMSLLTYKYGMAKPDLTLLHEQQQAEKEMLEYHKGMITTIKSSTEKHQSVLG